MSKKIVEEMSRGERKEFQDRLRDADAQELKRMELAILKEKVERLEGEDYRYVTGKQATQEEQQSEFEKLTDAEKVAVMSDELYGSKTKWG